MNPRFFVSSLNKLCAILQIANLLKNLSRVALPEYTLFLANYKDALETIRKTSQNSPQFSEMTRQIKFKSNQQQTATLEELLHKPVARIQRQVAITKVCTPTRF